MKEKALILIGSKDFRSIAFGMGAMSVMQLFNLFLPVIIIPIIISAYGIANYGVLAFATAACMFINVVCEYGFDLSATKEIAAEESKSVKRQLFFNVFYAKILLFLALSVLYLIVVFSVESYRQNFMLFLGTLGIVIGNILLPMWYLQGEKKFKFLSIVVSLSKVLSLGMLILALTFAESLSFFWVSYIISLGYILPGVLGFIYVLRSLNYRWSLPEIDLITNLLKGGYHVFLSRLFVFSYTSMNIIFLEVLSSSKSVALFSIASRVVGACSTLFSMLNKVIYPYLVSAKKRDYKQYSRIIEGYSLFLALSVLATVCFLLLAAPFIVEVLSGDKATDSILTLRVLSIALIGMPIGGLLTSLLVAKGLSNYVLRITFATTAVNFCAVFLLVPYLDVVGLALASIIVQTFQVAYNIYAYRRSES